MVPYYRFVEPHLKDGGQPTRVPIFARPSLAGTPHLDDAVATIEDETRYVLPAPASTMLMNPRVVRVSSDGHLALAVDVPPQFAGARRIVLAPSVKRGSHWSSLPIVVTAVEGTLPHRSAQLRLAMPAGDFGSVVKLRVDGLGISEERTTSWRTADVRIPSGARLDFGIGILPFAWSEGPVEFAVKACAGNDCEPLFSETLDPATAEGQRWQDRSVSLQHLAWRRRTFLFETRYPGDGNGTFSFPLWANPTLNASAARHAESPNVILLSIDTLSAQHLKTYGYEHDTAPFMDETFGKHGTVVERCVAAATTTPASHMSMLTSVQPCIHGVHSAQILPPWFSTLAEELRAAGFETGAFTEDGWLSVASGFGRGFDTYGENRSPDVMTPEGQVELTFHQAKEWLARNRDKRFFLFLHTFQVHGPYTPPPAYASLFGSHRGQPITQASPQFLRDRADYDREIRYTDDQLRVLFEALKTNGLDKNTIFILVSDHGEEFAEHGLIGHGAHFYEEVSHVPLMFWGPGRITAGKRITEPVGHIDLMPTILDVAGVPKPPQVMGVSFVGQLRDGAAVRVLARPLFTEAHVEVAMLPNHALVPFQAPAFMVQLGTQKLSRYRRDQAFTYEWYDLIQDPGELANQYAEDGATGPLADLRAAVDGYEAGCKAVVDNLVAASGHSATQTPKTAELDPAQEERLRALGYLNH